METEQKHPIQLVAPRPLKSSRLLAFGTLLFMIPKLVMLIPHFIILYFLGIIMVIVAFFAQVVVLFTGKYPENFYNLVKGTLQWQLRMNLYLLGVTDQYPPFSLK
ncbi:MAG: DUF4389 domain-containing protein [Patescibacteria group bacterium]